MKKKIFLLSAFCLLPNEYLWGIVKGEDDNPHLSIYVSFLDQADVCQ